MEFRRRKKRDEIEICADILQVAKGGARKTHIMYRANLSFGQLTKYINRLMSSGLLTNNSDSGLYETTDEGLFYLRNFEEFKKSRSVYFERGRLLVDLIRP